MKGNKTIIKIYPDSHVEVQGLSARYYDQTLNIATAGYYDKFIKSAIAEMNIQPDEHILDLGCGTGRNACLMHEYTGDSGHITGMDISEEMGDQFKRNCAAFNNVEYRNQRVDITFAPLPSRQRFYTTTIMHKKGAILMSRN